MNGAEKLTWCLIGSLVAVGVALTFLLHVLLGAAVAVLVLAAVWWYLIRDKRRTDAALAVVATEAGLEILRHPFAYNALRGTYDGFTVRIEGASEWREGAGHRAAHRTGLANLALLDIRNRTAITIEVDRELGAGVRTLEDGARVLLQGRTMTRTLPSVSRDPQEILTALRALTELARDRLAEIGAEAQPPVHAGWGGRLSRLPWYVKLWIAFGVALLTAACLILYHEFVAERTVWREQAVRFGTAPGTFAVPLAEPAGRHRLVMILAFEDEGAATNSVVFVEVRAPDGTTVLEKTALRPGPATRYHPLKDRHLAHYRLVHSFTSGAAGVHDLQLFFSNSPALKGALDVDRLR
ncbi:MAG: hypothetical protein JXR37_27165 [Kiritimatiellae bacterium]|nr:hypothetical protein [Kiritimatiellia bacterium]